MKIQQDVLDLAFYNQYDYMHRKNVSSDEYMNLLKTKGTENLSKELKKLYKNMEEDRTVTHFDRDIIQQICLDRIVILSLVELYMETGIPYSILIDNV